MWEFAENGKTINTYGTESGEILRDEEYKHSCRITLEKNCGSIPYAITCGVYGLMVHTVYAGSEQEALAKYDAMKNELQKFIDDDTADCLSWCERFVDQF